MNWMLLKQKAEIPHHSIELCTVIAKTNQALTVTRAQCDDDVNRLVARLAAMDSAASRYPSRKLP
jgi:hypothetical protein